MKKLKKHVNRCLKKKATLQLVAKLSRYHRGKYLNLFIDKLWGAL